MKEVVLKETFKFLKEILQDNRTGKYSHAKVIAVCGFFAVTAFLWKMILTGALTIDFFIAYLTYCTGTQTLNKLLDTNKTRGNDTGSGPLEKH